MQTDQQENTRKKEKGHVETSEQSSKSRKKDARIAKYFIRHHAREQIIGGETKGILERKKLKVTFFLSEFEPWSANDALENEVWIEKVNDKIEKIEKNNTWSLLPSPKDKNLIGTKYIFWNNLNGKG